MKSINIIGAIAGLLILSSCNFDINIGQVHGNGNVVTEDRSVTAEFNEVKGSAGLDVYLTEGSENKIVVEADENLLDLIETSVFNGRLTIKCKENIGRSKAKKVHVTYTDLDHILSSSGADVIVNTVVKKEEVYLDASSGSNLEVEVFARELYAEASSGAQIKVRGKSISLNADGSSGSGINARELKVIKCRADASSGASITVHVKESLTTDATSGGSIKYYGDPTAVSNDKSRSGSVQKM